MKKVIAIISVLLGVVFLAGCGQQPVSQTQPTTLAPVAQQTVNNPAPENVKPTLDKKVLQDTVFTAVDNALKAKYQSNKDPGYATWDKKVDIESVDVSQKAAKGKWWQKDAWDWIAWQQDNGNWKVLVSFDGFSCKELDSVPSQYATFFKDVVYQFGNKYCY